MLFNTLITPFYLTSLTILQLNYQIKFTVILSSQTIANLYKGCKKDALKLCLKHNNRAGFWREE